MTFEKTKFLCGLTGKQISTVLFCLEGYVAGLDDLVTQNDTFRAMVKGTIRGARTVRINPTGEDTYETVLEIDQDMVAYLFRQAQSL